MYRSGKLVLYLSHVRGNSMARYICYYRHLLCGIVNNSQGPIYPSRVLQHTLSHQNDKALHVLGANLAKDMSSIANEEFRHLDYDQLIETKNTPNNIIIDVREKKELDETGLIPGAYHIPLGDIEVAFNTPEDEFKKKYNFDKPSKETSLIFSCRSGKRSLVALEKAVASGFKNAKHYKGGWLDWEKHLSESKK